MFIVAISVKIAEALILPPGLFITLLIMASVKLNRLNRAFSLFLSVVAISLYIICSVVGVWIFVRPLEKGFAKIEDFHPDAVVVFGGGVIKTPYGYQLGPNTIFRLLSGIELSLKYNVPIIISGGSLPGTKKVSEAIIMKDFAENYLPVEMIILEPKAMNTKQNAEHTVEIAKKYGFKRLYLVSSAVHLKRSIWSFGQIDLEIKSYPANYLYDYSTSWIDFLPNKDALNANLSAIHELFGILYYKLLDILNP